MTTFLGACLAFETEAMRDARCLPSLKPSSWSQHGEDLAKTESKEINRGVSEDSFSQHS